MTARPLRWQGSSSLAPSACNNCTVTTCKDAQLLIRLPNSVSALPPPRVPETAARELLLLLLNTQQVHALAG